MEIWTISRLPKGLVFDFTGDMRTNLSVGDTVYLWNEKELVEGNYEKIIYSTAKILKCASYDVFQAQVES
jgi:hypothetical protein